MAVAIINYSMWFRQQYNRYNQKKNVDDVSVINVRKPV